MRLLEEPSGRAGYLLKDRVSDVAVVADVLRRTGDGESMIDPTIVSRLVARRRTGPLEDLTEREHEVPGPMAEGHSNEGIGEPLILKPVRRPTSARSSSSSARERGRTTAASWRCSRSCARAEPGFGRVRGHGHNWLSAPDGSA
jgi:hypothetical protein